MPIPRINPKLMSAAARANLERLQMQFAQPNENKNEVVEETKGKTKPIPRKKKTLTPDIAHELVKGVKISEDGNEVKIVLGLSPAETPTAQQKGAFVGKDGKVHFFTKAKIAKAEKAMKIALEPYAHYTRKWGRVPIEVVFKFLFPYASGTPKKERHKIGPMLERPDVDNIVKLHLDCLTQVGYWEDDSLVNTLHLAKRRTTGPSCITITITNLQPKFDALYRETEDHDNPNLFNPSAAAQKPSETNPLSDLLKGEPSSTPNERTPQIGMQ